MLKNRILLLLFCCCFQFLQAQQELGLHMMRNVFQSSRTNPALMPKQKIFVGLTSPYFNYYHTTGSIDDLVNRRDGGTFLNVDRLISLAGPDNQLNIHLELETLSLGYRFGKVALSLNHAVKSNTYINYPKTLPQLFWEGNSQFIGQTIEFGPDQQSFAYNEFGLGAGINLGALSIGVRAKLLAGIGDVSTPNTTASLSTDSDIYQLELETDYRINTSRFAPTFLFDSLNNVEVEYGFSELFGLEEIFSSNTGFAFDLGLHFQVNEKLELAASVIDIGKINWEDNITNYTSKGTYSYAGLELSNILQNDQIDFEGTLDTLQDIFDFKETSESYSTKLPAKYYLSALYQLTDRWQIGAMYYSEHFRGQSETAIALNANVNLGKYLRLGASYALRNDTYDNVGLQAVAQIGPIQVYAMTDDVVAAFRPYASQNVNGRIGLNLLFD